MNIARRLFLKRGGFALASLGATSLWGPEFVRSTALAADVSGAATRKKVLVCVFQRGAVDGMSMVVPHGDPFYYKHRQEIAIDRPAHGADSNAIDLDGFFGLHPAMKALLPLYQQKELAIVQACGSPSESRSHFDMQDFMESGTADDKSVHTGWLNRMIKQRHESGKPTPFRAVAMGSVLPRSFQGSVEALAICDLSTFGIRGGAAPANVAAGFEGMYDSAVGDVLGGAGAESFEAISMLKKADPTKYTPAHSADYPKNAFGHAMLQVAQLIKADVSLEVAFVDVDGWDTHANQGGAAGQLAGRLFDYSNTLASFHRDLGDRMQDVLVLTMSEFGRAARQNGNRGTDHGHGNCFFAIGGAVQGGKVHGHWPGLAPENLFENRDLAVTTDFRDVFAETCVRHMGLEVSDLSGIFPKYAANPDRFAGICKV